MISGGIYQKSQYGAAMTAVTPDENSWDAQQPYPASFNPNRRFLIKKAYLYYRRAFVTENKAVSSDVRRELHLKTTLAIDDYNLVTGLSDPSAFRKFPFPQHIRSPDFR